MNDPNVSEIMVQKYWKGELTEDEMITVDIAVTTNRSAREWFNKYRDLFEEDIVESTDEVHSNSIVPSTFFTNNSWDRALAVWRELYREVEVERQNARKVEPIKSISERSSPTKREINSYRLDSLETTAASDTKQRSRANKPVDVRHGEIGYKISADRRTVNFVLGDGVWLNPCIVNVSIIRTTTEGNTPFATAEIELTTYQKQQVEIHFENAIPKYPIVQFTLVGK